MMVVENREYGLKYTQAILCIWCQTHFAPSIKNIQLRQKNFKIIFCNNDCVITKLWKFSTTKIWSHMIIASGADTHNNTDRRGHTHTLI